MPMAKKKATNQTTMVIVIELITNKDDMYCQTILPLDQLSLREQGMLSCE